MPRVAKVAPVAPRKILDASEQQVGQPGVAVMSSVGDAVLEKPDIQIVGAEALGDKAAQLAFMEEPVVVMVHTTTDPQEPSIIELFNDGRRQNFVRGMEQTVKRKFVEVLARCRTDSYGSEEGRDNDNNPVNRYPKRTGLRYPFSVIHDSPRGTQWLKDILKEG